jgi:hypothetical protein
MSNNTRHGKITLSLTQQTKSWHRLERLCSFVFYSYRSALMGSSLEAFQAG